MKSDHPPLLSLELDFYSALSLYVFFREREEQLPDPVAETARRIGEYLYDRLTIEEMESPGALLSQLDRAK